MFTLCRRPLLVLLFPLLFAGCAGTEHTIVLFPLPPETPRIEWLGTYASQDDFPKSSVQVFFEGLTGKPPLATMKSPFGIAVDSHGLIYIADTLDSNLRVYNFEKKEVNYYTKSPYFGRPNGIAFDAADNLYVADGGKQAVLVFNAERQPLRIIGGPQDFKSPACVKIDNLRDRVYVSDSKGNKIVVYNRAGEKLMVIGPQIDETHWIFNPQGMAIDKDGNLFVAEMLNARITVLSPEGKVLRVFGERGDAAYQFEAPKDLAFDSDGNLWVADNRRPQIYTYTPEGRLLLATGGAATTSTGALAFASPTGIFIDANDRVLVTDRLNRRFSVWHYRSSAYNATHPLTPAEEAALAAASAKAKKLKGEMTTPAEKP